MIKRNMPFKRKDRVASQLKKAISRIIEIEIDDERLKEVTLTDITLSDDLRHARIYVGVSLTGGEREDVMRLLEKAKGFIKRNLSAYVRLKHMPTLTFEYDSSIDYGFKIDKILRDIADDRTDR